jgi:hypothetical protein
MYGPGRRLHTAQDHGRFKHAGIHARKGCGYRSRSLAKAIELEEKSKRGTTGNAPETLPASLRT